MTKDTLEDTEEHTDLGTLEVDQLERIELSRIRPDPDQPRHQFDETDITALAESMRALGQLQPILVRADVGQDGYIIVAGERRYRAAVVLEEEAIDAIIVNFDQSDLDNHRLLVQAAENLGRIGYTPVEVLDLIVKISGSGLSDKEAAGTIGLSMRTWRRYQAIHNDPTASDLLRSGVSLRRVLASMQIEPDPDLDISGEPDNTHHTTTELEPYNHETDTGDGYDKGDDVIDPHLSNTGEPHITELEPVMPEEHTAAATLPQKPPLSKAQGWVHQLSQVWPELDERGKDAIRTDLVELLGL